MCLDDFQLFDILFEHLKCGYRIMAIMCPCQGQETGPIPVTRSTTTPSVVVQHPLKS